MEEPVKELAVEVVMLHWKWLVSKGCLSLLAALSLVLFLPGCGEEPPRDERISLSLVSGGSGSHYADLALAIAETVNTRSTMIKVVPQLSAGPEANLRQLTSGTTPLAVVTGDLVHYARENTEMFQDRPMEADFLPLARLDLEPLVILFREDSSITEISGLEGRRISLGKGGSRTQILSQKLLLCLGFDMDKASILYLEEGEALRYLGEDRLDAAFLLAPNPGDLIGAGSTRYLPLLPQGPLAEALPFLTVAPSPFQPEEWSRDLLLPAVPVILAASERLDGDILEELIRSLRGSPFLLLPPWGGPSPPEEG